MNSASDKGKAESGNKRLEQNEAGQNGYGVDALTLAQGLDLDHKNALIARLKLMNDAV